MGQRQPVVAKTQQRRTPRLPRCGLQATGMAAVDLHIADGKWHFELIAQRAADVGPGFRTGNEAVAHMTCRQFKPQQGSQTGQHME